MVIAKSKLKQKHYLITGDDEFAVKERAREVIAELKPDDEMNFEVVDGQAENVDEACRRLDAAIEAILTLPFLGGKKVVFLKNCTFLGDTVTGRSEQVKDRLQKLLSVAEKVGAESAQLVISAAGVDRRKVFYKGFVKLGECEFFELPDLNNVKAQEGWLEQVHQWMRDAGLNPGEGVVERMVELLGNDRRAMHAEMEKLFLYAHPEGKVEEEDLRKVVSGNRELLIWDLCDAVTEGDASESIAILRQLLKQGESDVGILILVSRHLRLAALCRHLVETGRLRIDKRGRFLNATITPEGNALLPVNRKGETPKPFRLARIAEQAKARKAFSWFQKIEVLYQIHFQLLSSGVDKRLTLEAGILKLCERDS